MALGSIELGKVLVENGLSPDDIEERASQIVLFGSRAAGVAGPESDWDLLCIGDGESIHLSRLDLIWVSEKDLTTRKWLGSELATHIAAYGKWLLGVDSWSQKAFVSRRAKQTKRRAVLTQSQELSRLWSSLLPSRQAKQARRLRRQVQRLAYLVDGRAVPSSPLLDLAWKRHRAPTEDLKCSPMIAAPSLAEP